MGEVITKTTFELPNKKIRVKYIKRNIGMAAGDHIGPDHVISGGLLDKAVKKYQVPRLRSGVLKNILTNEEKEYFEKVFKGIDLSIYGEFWKDFYVTLFKQGKELNLSDPNDYLSWKVLLSLSDEVIAPSWDRRYERQSYEFALVNEGDEDKELKKKFDAKKEAFKLYGKIEDDREVLLGVLKLIYNKPVSSDSKLEWIQTKIEEFIDTKATNFIDIVKDKSFYTKLLLNKAVDLGVVNRLGNKYETADGLEICENGEVPTFDNAVNYLDNPKNQEIRSLIEAKINNAKE